MVMEDLKNRFGWITLVYRDGTRKHIFTTTMKEQLDLRGLKSITNNKRIYDFRLNEWVDYSDIEGLFVTEDLSEVSTLLSRELIDYI